ncbi:colicin immunity domain-containing protein [Mesorhizobium sp. VNQ89]|uniref:colicin immunity domain-containing protein n=1 Tax=Mesorhizobium quangtriensis TaxID=3157709 RepID=UPI0032B8531E
MRQFDWKALIETFVSGRMDGPTFEKAFLDARRAEIEAGISERFSIDLLFYEVDAYCSDPTMMGPDDIDVEQLRIEARKCLARWGEPWPEI